MASLRHSSAEDVLSLSRFDSGYGTFNLERHASDPHTLSDLVLMVPGGYVVWTTRARSGRARLYACRLHEGAQFPVMYRGQMALQFELSAAPPVDVSGAVSAPYEGSPSAYIDRLGHPRFTCAAGDVAVVAANVREAEFEEGRRAAPSQHKVVSQRSARFGEGYSTCVYLSGGNVGILVDRAEIDWSTSSQSSVSSSSASSRSSSSFSSRSSSSVSSASSSSVSSSSISSSSMSSRSSRSSSLGVSASSVTVSGSSPSSESVSSLSSGPWIVVSWDGSPGSPDPTGKYVQVGAYNGHPAFVRETGGFWIWIYRPGDCWVLSSGIEQFGSGYWWSGECEVPLVSGLTWLGSDGCSGSLAVTGSYMPISSSSSVTNSTSSSTALPSETSSSSTSGDRPMYAYCEWQWVVPGADSHDCSYYADHYLETVTGLTVYGVQYHNTVQDTGCWQVSVAGNTRTTLRMDIPGLVLPKGRAWLEANYPEWSTTPCS